MTFRSPGQPRPAAGRPLVLPRWPKLLIPVAAGLVALIIVVSVVAGVWTDYLWFRSVGYTSVFGTTYGTKWLLFLVTAIFMAAVVGANAWLAYRLRPPLRPSAADQQSLEGYRTVVDPHRRLVLGRPAGPDRPDHRAVRGEFLADLAAVRQPDLVPHQDPQFHLDLSFFVFVYPFLRMVLTYLFTAVLISLVVAVIVHYLYGALRPQVKGQRATAAARAHLFVLVGVFVLLKAAAYWVDRYGIDFSQRGVVRTGASYTDVNAILPAKTVLAVIAVLCAVLFFAGAIRRQYAAARRRLRPAGAVRGADRRRVPGDHPAVRGQAERAGQGEPVHQPGDHSTPAWPTASAASRSSRTRPASSLPAADLAGWSATCPTSGCSTRPWCRRPSSSSSRSRATTSSPACWPWTATRSRLGHPAGHRHRRAGHGRPAVRPGQLDQLAPGLHARLRRGRGPGEHRAGRPARPAFTESDIPPTGSLGLKQPRVYFGQQETSYAIVGGRQAELDYPNGSTGGQQNTHYTGGGGVPVGSPLNRLLYAVKFRQLNILLSGAINGNSKIMYIRDPLSRVQKVAPFLTLDGDPYPVVCNGGIDWVVDAYTTTNDYPYSQRIGLRQASTDSYFPNGSVFGAPGQVNYVRNSVKAVVNAYTGKVTLYQWGTKRPGPETWKKAFPGRDQAAHATSRRACWPTCATPRSCSRRSGRSWPSTTCSRPSSSTAGRTSGPCRMTRAGPARPGSSQPPYYLTLSSMPGYKQPEFSLVTSFNPRGRPNMAAFMAVEQQPGQPRLRHDPAAGTAAGHRVPRARPGAERLRVRPDRGLRADPAAPGRLPGHHRQPDHPAGRRRPGLLRAAVRVPVGAAAATPARSRP